MTSAHYVSDVPSRPQLTPKAKITLSTTSGHLLNLAINTQPCRISLRHHFFFSFSEPSITPCLIANVFAKPSRRGNTPTPTRQCSSKANAATQGSALSCPPNTACRANYGKFYQPIYQRGTLATFICPDNQRGRLPMTVLFSLSLSSPSLKVTGERLDTTWGS